MHQIGNPIHARFLAIDEGRQTLSLIDTNQPEAYWTLDLRHHPLARSMQRLGPDVALICFDRGFFELEISTGRIITTVSRWSKVTAAWRQDDLNP